MNLQLQKKSDLTFIARETFDDVLAAVNPMCAVEHAVRIEGEQLFVAGFEFDLREINRVYSVALGKAAFKMARGLSASLSDILIGGVISAVSFDADLPKLWQPFVGGHPTPNAASLAAGKAAFELLKVADKPESLVIFLISGGGSAMVEQLIDENMSLADLQTTNKILVNCGATIGEINRLRRQISKVKNNGLSRVLNAAKSVSLIISDTNETEAHNVASGPTIETPNDLNDVQIQELIERYNLREKLPQAILKAVQSPKSTVHSPKSNSQNWRVILSNQTALEAAAKALRNKGFVVEKIDDLIETPIAAGCAELVERLCKFREKTVGKKPVAIVSGGEFVCPVRGEGIGGRNLESALRTTILFDELRQNDEWRGANFAALFAGTDGIDGNSPAAGAIVDESTMERARDLDLDAQKFLSNSDSYNFFAQLSQQIEIGATGTNVRDVRILLAR